MTRLRGIALTLCLIVALAGCTPAVTVPAADRPMPASAGTLVLMAPPGDTEPPVLLLDTTPAVVTRAPGDDLWRVYHNGYPGNRRRYVLRPARLDPPRYWFGDGFVGTKEACLADFLKAWPEAQPLEPPPPPDTTTPYKVVINGEEQYSVWPAARALPAGWRETGKSGNLPECLDYIKQVWTDMRPLSLRQQLDEKARQQG